MPLYRVKWEIDIDAESYEEAAEQAWEIMKEQENEASFLDLQNHEEENPKTITIFMPILEETTQ